MSTQDKARELLAKDRQHETNLHENMVVRASEAEGNVPDGLDEKARELLTEDRQQEQQLEDTMLSRSVEEIS